MPSPASQRMHRQRELEQKKKGQRLQIWILSSLIAAIGLLYLLPLALSVKPPRLMPDQERVDEAIDGEAFHLRAEIALLEAQIAQLKQRDARGQKAIEDAEMRASLASEGLALAKQEADRAIDNFAQAQKADEDAKKALLLAQSKEQSARSALISANEMEQRALRALALARQIEKQAQEALEKVIATNQLSAGSRADLAYLQERLETLSADTASQAQQDNEVAAQSPADDEQPREEDDAQTETAETQLAQSYATRALPAPGRIIKQYEAGKVAPQFAVTLPDELDELTVPQRKQAFIETLLPLILEANDQLRARQAALEFAIETENQAQIARFKALYRLRKFEGDRDALIAELRHRIQPIPPSLALAQAAVESGWGLSRFAREGNALFGQWAWSEDAGMKPLDASNSRAVIRSFPSIYDSIVAYMHNLNTHYAYAPLRDARAALIANEQPVTGMDLAAYLTPYAETGDKYVYILRAMILQNRFDIYEDHILASQS